jgi:hypothetical protein
MTLSAEEVNPVAKLLRAKSTEALEAQADAERGLERKRYMAAGRRPHRWRLNPLSLTTRWPLDRTVRQPRS